MAVGAIPAVAHAQVEPSAPQDDQAARAGDATSASETKPTETVSNVVWWLGARSAFVTAPIRNGTTPFGAGFGGAFGFSAFNVYVAANAMYFIGGSDVVTSDASVLYGVEIGYDFHLFRDGNRGLILRPRVGGGGVALFHTDPSTAKVDVVSSASGTRSSRSSDTTTVNAFYVQPAVGVLWSAERFFVGLTGSVLVLPRVNYGSGSATDASTWLAYGASADLGLHF
ncbi:MAG: hypothetical protein HOO96_42590 [Polyangiaceae bacterium]|nr:hypothetical protein [Polyangiaceae bacterium]